MFSQDRVVSSRRSSVAHTDHTTTRLNADNRPNHLQKKHDDLLYYTIPVSTWRLSTLFRRCFNVVSTSTTLLQRRALTGILYHISYLVIQALVITEDAFKVTESQ